MDQNKMQSKGVSPGDLLNALNAQNVVLPSGTVKVGAEEYDVRTNAAPRTIDELGMLPIKEVNGAVVYIRDVATVSSAMHFRPMWYGKTVAVVC
jgi:multidrug efflux pump subunit AcrB